MLVRPTRKFPGTAFIIQGSALQDIWPYLLLVGVVSGVVTWFHEPWGLDRVSLTAIPFSIMGVALSIFLGFRNNACYDRWWEARKLWGRLINTSRSLARQTLTLVGPTGEEDVQHRELVRMVVGYAHALRLHLRRQDRWEEVTPFLPADLAATLPAERNKPVAILQALAQRYRDAWRGGRVDTLHLPVLEASLTDLTDIQGGCERIKNTPVPLSYTILTHRIVAVYCLGLPFGIVGDVGPLTPLVVVIVSFAFMGLDDVGTQLEDPFEEDENDLPLGQLSRLIENDLRQRLGDEDLRPDIRPEGGILL